MDLKATGVETCRLCLAANVKLYSLLDTHLGLCMKSIGGFTKSYEGLPNYVCYECAPILIKCNKLMEKSRTAQATLVDIFNKNGQINVPLIQEETKSKPNLKSSLESYLSLDYFYINYEDNRRTSNTSKTKSDPNEKINKNLKTNKKEESSDEVANTELMKMFKDFIKEGESHTESDVEVIAVDVPTIEISSDDEKNGDDDFRLKSYAVKMDNSLKGLLAQNDNIPRYYSTKNMRPLGVAKKGKKYKQNKKMIRQEPSSATSIDYIKRYFHIQGTRSKLGNYEYCCKSCGETFDFIDNARDHTIIGCQNLRSNPVFGKNVYEPNDWKQWPGGSK